MSVLRLRCKTKSGTHGLTSNLFGTSSIEELQNAIYLASGVSIESQKIMLGFPPKELDLTDNSKTLNDLCIRSGDTFTVVDTQPVIINKHKPRSEPSMKRKEVPADNSCLFYSVYFCLKGYLTDSDYNEAKQYRADIANVVLSNPNKYTEAFLGKAPSDYSVWIQCDTSWGGGIELSILSEIYQMEIAAIDIQTLRVDNYGQDEKYTSRIFLLYDGIHYDPMFLDPEDELIPTQTIFSTSDDGALTQALKHAEQAHRLRQFTDVANFTLQCLTCYARLQGQRSAQQHAKETGHGNFGELN